VTVASWIVRTLRYCVQNVGLLRGPPDAVSPGNGIREDHQGADASSAGISRSRLRQRQSRLHDVLHRQLAGACLSLEDDTVTGKSVIPR